MAGRQNAWTQDEEDYLINNYKKLPIKELQKNINRSEKAIRTRANILGLYKSTPLLDYHDRIVSMLDKGKTATEIAEVLDSTPYSVGQYMRHMKLKTKQVSMNFSKLAIMNGIDDPINFKQENMSVKQWYIYWYQMYRKATVREVTRDKYRLVFGTICTHPLADMLIKEVSRGEAQNYLNWYGERRSKQTVLDHWQFLRSCFSDAMQDGHVDRNPFANIKPIYEEMSLTPKEMKKKRDEKKWLEMEEYNKLKYHMLFWFNEALNTSPIRNFSPQTTGKTMPAQITYMIIFLALKTGARYSEILGITENDIEFRDKQIVIDKTWDYKLTYDFIPTKNISSIRTIEVDDETIDVLKRYIEWVNKFGINTDKGALFVEKGVRAHNSTVNSHLTNLLKSLNIEPITLHKLRHTQASILIANNVPLQVVAKRLGHSNTNMVQRVYGHLLETTEEEGNRMIMRLI